MKPKNKKQSKNFRTYTTQGLHMVCGKNQEQNEELMQKVISRELKPALIMHTKDPGSSFCLLFGNKNIKLSKKSLQEAAIFCAAYSKAKKIGKKKIEVHGFKAEDVYKTPRMRTGTFGVKKILWKHFVEVKG